jgi:bis(5'-nucleosyl)-tetraphosphatase (symmetrical)
VTTYVIGDIQGCYAEFTALLAKIEFDPQHDQLWSVGDLINRGSDNLATLRWFYANRSVVKVVLGNHDLHLLAHHAGVGKKSRSDNFEDILEAEDADILLGLASTAAPHAPRRAPC